MKSERSYWLNPPEYSGLSVCFGLWNPIQGFITEPIDIPLVPPRSLWIDRNVSLLCHRGDPLLVAGECPACQRPDCFHSPEQVSAFLLVK